MPKTEVSTILFLQLSPMTGFQGQIPVKGSTLAALIRDVEVAQTTSSGMKVELDIPQGGELWLMPETVKAILCIGEQMPQAQGRIVTPQNGMQGPGWG